MKIGNIQVDEKKIIFFLLILGFIALIAAIGFAFVSALAFDWLWDQMQGH